MKRTNPTFKEQTLTEEETLEFIDDLFNNLFDNDDISTDYDQIPDLSALK